MAHCVVIGNPIAHSLSPMIHQAFAKQAQMTLTYERLLGDEQLFEQQVLEFFAQGGTGMNVTLPFKQRAFSLATVSSLRCQKAGAANTLWLNEHQELCADNTDGVGLIRDLSRHVSLLGARVLILGAGGAARGIIHPLLEAQPQQLVVANRSAAPLLRLQAEVPQLVCVPLDQLSGSFDVVIHATSASTSGASLSVPDTLFSSLPFCYDLAYQKDHATPFVRYAQQRGCKACDGFGMLVEQAAEAFYIWHGVRIKLPL